MTTARQDDAARLGVAGEQRVEAIEQTGDGEGDDEADEHRQAADRRERFGVHGPLARVVQPASRPSQPADERRRGQRDEGGDGTDDEVVTGHRHEPGAYGSPSASSDVPRPRVSQK